VKKRCSTKKRENAVKYEFIQGYDLREAFFIPPERIQTELNPTEAKTYRKPPAQRD
jgi:hypothetical protein